MSKYKHIILVAGEASGDMHGAALVKELRKINSNITFSGLGGKEMELAGVRLYEDLTKLAVVGFWEVLKNYKSFRKIFYNVLSQIKKTQPQAVILIDYPGFNLRLAKKLKKIGVKVIYYISPQVWAWKKNRVYDIKKYVDRMLVIFEFEKEFYKNFDIEVTHVGHPLIDTVTVTTSKENFCSSHKIDSTKKIIGLLPGSREKEVQTLLPIMLKTAQELSEKYSDIHFLIAVASTINAEDITPKIPDNIRSKITLIPNDTYNAINACNLCIVTSGTATLETAILQKPLIVVYKTSFLTWILAKTFIKIPNIGLVNVVAKKRIVPECIQFEANAETISAEIIKILSNKSLEKKIKQDLASITQTLNQGKASQRAAQEINLLI